jgi:hypothetical protein
VCHTPSGAIVDVEEPGVPGDLKALAALLGDSEPKMKCVRCRRQGQAFYGLGDASGSSFRALFQVNGVVDAEYG